MLMVARVSAIDAEVTSREQNNHIGGRPAPTNTVRANDDEQRKSSLQIRIRRISRCRAPHHYQQSAGLP
jgi:hypothetical protein